MGVQRIDAAPGAMNIAFAPNPPVDAGRIIELIQRNRDIKLIGNEKLRIERSTSSAQDRARIIREILRHIAVAQRAVAA
jgi:transcription-repair coupling factor (superfamily II helicase)